MWSRQLLGRLSIEGKGGRLERVDDVGVAVDARRGADAKVALGRQVGEPSGRADLIDRVQATLPVRSRVGVVCSTGCEWRAVNGGL